MVYTFEPVDVSIFLTLILLEGVLSFDNAAILAAMVRKLPVEQRKKALLYGLGGAFVFRTAAIFSVVFIVENPWLKLVGGGYLLFLAVKHLRPGAAGHEHDAAPPGFLMRMGLTGFWSTVLAIEVADLVFALDQVLVAVAMTEKVALIVAASVVAIIFLRLSATYVAKLMDWFPPLERLAYAAVGWVGLKLLAVEVARMVGYPFDIPKVITIGVTFALLVVPVLVKFLVDRVRARRAHA